MSVTTIVMVAQSLFVGMLAYSPDRDLVDMLFLTIIGGSLIGLYGGLRYGEGVLEGRKQAGQDLNPHKRK